MMQIKNTTVQLNLSDLNKKVNPTGIDAAINYS